VSIPTYSRPNIYTVVFQDGSLAEYLDTANILEAAPTQCPASVVTLLPDWIQQGAKTTLFSNNMSKPRHGTLLQNDKYEWFFCPGTSKDITLGTFLHYLSANFQNLIDTGQLFWGYTKFRRVYQTRNQIQLRHCVLHHVSAHGLSSLTAPPSLKGLSTLSPEDQAI
jgi:hypothetical protein